MTEAELLKQADILLIIVCCMSVLSGLAMHGALLWLKRR